MPTEPLEDDEDPTDVGEDVAFAFTLVEVSEDGAWFVEPVEPCDDDCEVSPLTLVVGPQAASVTVKAPAPITAPTLVARVALRTPRSARSRRATAASRSSVFMATRLPCSDARTLNQGWDLPVNSADR